MRFCLVDRIVEIEAGSSITAIKNLTSGEEYLADHFPGFPIMPGVMMVESLVQTGSWLMRYTESFAFSTVLLKEARAVKFSNFVKPGQTLRMECQIHKRDEQQYVLKCAGTVEGNPAVSARLTLEQFNLSDHNSEMAETDRRTVERLRDHFDSLWTPIVQG
ncbi:MAG: beta-hydroxyacyl-ACP dehydratase [Planctomycetaceae bacterium]|nr:beta-hydroxyacyl-ACP dehydratase [Planctomycetaceae bacterium]